MKFVDKLRAAAQKLMRGRYGADQLGSVLIYGGIIGHVLASLFGWLLLLLLSTAAWAWGLVRMFSRNFSKRAEENRKYLELKNKAFTEGKQAYARFQRRKEYVYFRCPQCKTRLRLPRNLGEVTARCKNCGASIPKKT